MVAGLVNLLPLIRCLNEPLVDPTVTRARASSGLALSSRFFPLRWRRDGGVCLLGFAASNLWEDEVQRASVHRGRASRRD